MRSTGKLGSVRGRCFKAGRIRRLWRQHMSSFCFLILPAQPQDLVSYSFLLLSFFLATRLFDILPDIWFWLNLVTMTDTWTTTHAQTVMGQTSWWGHWGQKGNFHQKGIKSYRMRSIDAWLTHMHYLDPLYKSYHIKNSSGITWGHWGQKVIFIKKASSPTKCVALMRDSCICITLTPLQKLSH